MKKKDILEFIILVSLTLIISFIMLLLYFFIPIKNESYTKSNYDKAYELLKTLTLEEKISQTLLVSYFDNDVLNIQNDYQFGGFIFYEKDFKNKTKEDVIKMINDLQNVSKIKLLTAIDEEGGKVSRLSSNKNIVATPFKSSRELYQEGGFDLIKEDVIKKSSLLKELGLNLNLAPVVDVSQNPNDYIYSRTLGEDTTITSIYAQTVIEASKNTGVSYTLKHFPGYSNNIDTHHDESVETKSKEDIYNTDLPPFIAGINAGCEVIMVSHNIVSSIDPDNPASLSLNIHNILRDELNYEGIIITDDLNMKSVKNIPNLEVKAINAGNDILITPNYKQSFDNILNGINNKEIDIKKLDEIVLRILKWKYTKNLL